MSLKGKLDGEQAKRVGTFLTAMPDQEVTVEVKDDQLSLYATVNPSMRLTIGLEEAE
jgi:hypothetical protein